ncbi:MAG: glycosyltransferase [Candidatus Acidiferrales bacterium]
MMPERRYRVLLVASHVVQYSSPVYREMAKHPRLDTHVAYCSLQGAESGTDADFGREVKWDVPLLDGYLWTAVPNRAIRPGLGRFFGLVNLGLWRMVRKGRYDAIVLYTGYRYASFWISLAAAKLARTPVIFGTDATSIQIRSGARWKLWFKPFILSRIFHLADGAFGCSLAGKEFLKSLGLPSERIGVIPLVADNEWWAARAAEVNRAAVRESWGVPEGANVVLFCAKLQPWKRPHDLLQAFARADVAGSHLVFAGDGMLGSALESQATELRVRDRVHFLGFQNQTPLPAVYRSADLFVLPSEYDPCPVVVCEAMLCGLPVMLSDEIRGRRELIDEGETGYTFRCKDVEALATLLHGALADPGRLAAMGAAARCKMDSFSPRTHVRDFVHLLDDTLGVVPAHETHKDR